MPFTDYWKNAVLDRAIAGGSAITVYASLHGGAPGSTGANELTGGFPAYARKALTWGSAASGAKATTATVTFDIPSGGVTVGYVGYWDAATSGHFLGYQTVTSATFVGQDVYALTAVQLNQNANPSA